MPINCKYFCCSRAVWRSVRAPWRTSQDGPFQYLFYIVPWNSASRSDELRACDTTPPLTAFNMHHFGSKSHSVALQSSAPRPPVPISLVPGMQQMEDALSILRLSANLKTATLRNPSRFYSLTSILSEGKRFYHVPVHQPVYFLILYRKLHLCWGTSWGVEKWLVKK